jgi:hypothetical protein
VTDRHVLNDVAMSLMSMHFPNWKSFHEWYRSYADKAETALKEVTQAYKQFELDWWARVWRAGQEPQHLGGAGGQRRPHG